MISLLRYPFHNTSREIFPYDISTEPPVKYLYIYSRISELNTIPTQTALLSLLAASLQGTKRDIQAVNSRPFRNRDKTPGGPAARKQIFNHGHVQHFHNQVLTFRQFSLNRPSGPIQSLSRNVRMSSVCAIPENPLPGGLETSG